MSDDGNWSGEPAENFRYLPRRLLATADVCGLGDIFQIAIARPARDVPFYEIVGFSDDGEQAVCREVQVVHLPANCTRCNKPETVVFAEGGILSEYGHECSGCGFTSLFVRKHLEKQRDEAIKRFYGNS